MTLHRLRGRCWTIVCATYGEFLNSYKGIVPEQYMACCQPQPIISGTLGYQWYIYYLEVPKGLSY